MNKPLTIVTWLWKKEGLPSTHLPKTFTYNFNHVNAVYEMVKRHYHKPFRFVCITDNPKGIKCETIPLWKDNLNLAGIVPGTWVRVKVWAPEMVELLGPRIISLDLDCVVTDDLAPLFDRTEPFIGWLSLGIRRTPIVYNASIWAMDTGAFPEVWTSFSSKRVIRELAKAGYEHFHGTEQAWASYKLGRNQPAWTWKDGVISYRFQLERYHKSKLIPGARIVFFHGPKKPWNLRKRIPWIAEHYPEFK
jgi:hypothetical protein